jgi:hypothetical protein
MQESTKRIVEACCCNQIRVLLTGDADVEYDNKEEIDKIEEKMKVGMQKDFVVFPLRSRSSCNISFRFVSFPSIADDRNISRHHSEQ